MKATAQMGLRSKVSESARLVRSWLSEQAPKAEQPRRDAMLLARNEAQDIASAVAKHLPSQESGRFAWLLQRALLRRELVRIVAARSYSMVFATLLILPLLFFAARGQWGDSFSLTDVFLIATCYAAVFIITAIAIHLAPRRDEWRRMRRYGQPQDRQKAARSRRLANVLAISAALIWTGLLAAVAIQEGHFELLRALLEALMAFLWIAILFMLATPFLSQHIVIRRAPELSIVRHLASGFTLAEDLPQTQWGRIGARRKIALELGAASAILETSFLKSLSLVTSSAESPQRKALVSSAAGLRELAARAIAGGPEARSEVRRDLAGALAAAVEGDFAGIGALLGADPAGASPGPRSILSAMARLFRAFLLPVLLGAVLLASSRLGWGMADEVETLLGQAALLSFLMALLSVLDPVGYQQRLGAITATGGSLFGWGKPR